MTEQYEQGAWDFDADDGWLRYQEQHREDEWAWDGYPDCWEKYEGVNPDDGRAWLTDRIE